MFFTLSVPPDHGSRRSTQNPGNSDAATSSSKPTSKDSTFDGQEEYIGIYVVAYHQVVETQTLHWGIFLGRSLQFPGELHNFCAATSGKYYYSVEEDHTPLGKSGLRFIAAHRVGEIPTDAGSAGLKMLIDNMVLKKPGADSQDWTHAALDVLERSLMGWINTAKRLVLEEHLPRRKDPLKNCYYSTRGTARVTTRKEQRIRCRHDCKSFSCSLAG